MAQQSVTGNAPTANVSTRTLTTGLATLATKPGADLPKKSTYSQGVGDGYSTGYSAGFTAGYAAHTTVVYVTGAVANTVPVPSPYSPSAPQYMDHTADAINRLCQQFKG